MKKKFIIIDSNSLIHRAFHALPPLTAKNGELVNAVYGFLLVFLKCIKEFDPKYIAACFDLPGITFRHKEFKKYKATRPKTPKDLLDQIPKLKEILNAFSVPIFEKQGFEADDLIGTITKIVNNEQKTMSSGEIELIILSGDLDTLQVIDKDTKVYTLKRGVKDTVFYDEKEVKKRYQISPLQFVDFKALKGDSSDNIPGIPGIGEKTAITLLKEFGTLENLYKEIEKDSEKTKNIKPKIKNTLKELKEQAFLSKKLAQIRYDVPIDFNLKKCQWEDYDEKKVVNIFKKYEFYSLIDKLPKHERKILKRLF